MVTVVFVVGRDGVNGHGVYAGERGSDKAHWGAEGVLYLLYCPRGELQALNLPGFLVASIVYLMVTGPWITFSRTGDMERLGVSVTQGWQ